jgi:hypothetical protein
MNNRSYIITNNPKYILPGSEVYYKEYSTMFVYPGEDGFKNPNYFIDNRGRCFSKAWLGPSAFLKDETSIVPAFVKDPKSSCSTCGGGN